MKILANAWCKDLALILLMSLLVSFFGMWRIPISRTQEARIAVSAREVLQDGHWLIPTLNGQVRLEKPPLMTWLVACSYGLYGRINEFTARFPVYCFSLCAAILIYFFGLRLFGRRAARFAALILLTSFEFIRHSRLAEIDVALMLAVALTMFCWHSAWCATDGKFKRYFAGYLACAVAVNLKGPVGFVVPFVCFSLALVVTRNYRELKNWLHPASLLACALLSAAWYGYALYFHGGQTAAVFQNELNITFVRGTNHPGNVLYYFYTLLRCFAPWTLLMYGALAMTLLEKDKSSAHYFILTWVIATFGLLSLNPNKQPHYALLLLPAAALITGHAAEMLWRQARFQRWVQGAVTVLVLAMIAGTILDSFVFHSRLVPTSEFMKSAAEGISRRIAKTAPVYSVNFSAAVLAFYMDRKIPQIDRRELIKKRTAGDSFYAIFQSSAQPQFPGAKVVVSLRNHKTQLHVLQF